MTSSFFPVGTSRASTPLATQQLMFQINSSQNDILSLQNQLSTGLRITKPSQDPAAAIRALSAQRQLEYRSQVDSNLKSANTLLSVTESTLAQAQSIMQELQGLGVSSSTNVLSVEERDAAIAQIDAAYRRLMELGNSKFQDQYIFAGSDVNRPPFSASANAMRFTGDIRELNTIADFASTIAANVTADDAFGVRSKNVQGSVDLNPSVVLSTPLAALNGGLGVPGGVIQLSDGVNAVQVDLSNAYDLNDVVSKLNVAQLSGRTIRASLTSHSLRIEYQDNLPGQITISEVGAGTTAFSLGISNSSAVVNSPVLGTDLDAIIKPNTLLSQLRGGLGIAAGQSMLIKQGSKSYAISTNGLTTVEDLMNAIRRSGAKVEVSIDPAGKRLAVQSTESGSTLTIGENGGILTSSLGLRTMDNNTLLSSLNFGQGVQSNESTDDIVITRTDGTNFQIELSGAKTIHDVIVRINNHVSNFNPATRVVATLASVGNGLVLTAPAGAQQIRVANTGGSQAAIGLGLISNSNPGGTGSTVGGNSVIGGADVSGVQVDGIFSSLTALKSAIASNRPEDLPRIMAGIDADLQRLSLARGVVGARQQSISDLQEASANQQIQLKQVESDAVDADLAQVISDLSARQAALQASLQMMGQVSKLTLFNYI
jgi:flagellar hook-associated protein 3 FlgL